jgi:RimJ/RimL family protein N-acetyltransferase
LNAEVPITLRPARDDEDDARLLLAWRNDAETRAASFSSREVTWDEHVAWFEKSLADPSRHIYFALEEGRPVGVARLDDRGGGRAEINLIVAPEARGRGIAAPVLRAACELASRKLGYAEITGRIKEDNAASRRACVRAGFGPERREILKTDEGEIPIVVTTWKP